MGHQGYDISNWVVRYPAASLIKARPGLRAILYRVRFTVFAVALIAGLYVPAVKSPPALVPALQALALGFIALSLLPAAAALVQRLRIAQEYGRLVIQGGLFGLRRSEYPLSALRDMELLEYRVSSRTRSHWHVRVHTDHETLEFSCAVARSSDGAGCPERVARFVDALQRITGLVCAPPQRLEPSTGRTFTVSFKPQYRKEVYRSLEEMPPELRRRAEEQIARMRAEGSTRAEYRQFTVMDGDGRVHTYNSLDEMPPHLRERFEEARRSLE